MSEQRAAARGRRRALGGAALALIALAIVRGGGGGPPLYDGVCLSQKYLLLGSRPSPGSVTATYSVNQLADTQELQTPESPAPQAQLIIAANTLAAAPGATTVTVAITPVKPPPTQPRGAIDGNVYDFAATSAGRTVAVAASHPVTVGLQSTTSGATLTLEQYASGGWVSLRTMQSTCTTIYVAAAPSLGLFALVAEGATTTAPSGPVGPVVIVVLSVVALLAFLVAAVRLSRRRQKANLRTHDGDV